MTAAVILGLAQRLQASDPSNSHEQREIFERIRELRSAFDGPLDPESHRYLEAASMLIAYLARMGALAGEDVRAIAVRLLESAAEAESVASSPAPAPAAASAPVRGIPVIRLSPPPAAPAAAPAAPVATPEVGRKEELSATDLMGDMMLGQILLRRGHILEEHIHQAVKVQRATNMRIGDIMVKIGAATRAQVDDALSYQASCRRVRENLGETEKERLDRADTRGTGLKLMGEVLLGEILIERGVITRRQLERALEVQKQSGLRIGEALVKSGATSMDQIEQALRVQGQERRFSKQPPGKGTKETSR